MNAMYRLWKLRTDQDFGPLSILSQGIQEIEQRNPNILPNFRKTSRILVASDYSGQHNTAEFQILSFLFSDYQALLEWENARLTVRRKYLLNNREMSYKGLNDSYKKKALWPFLNSANSLSGLSVTVAIHKKVESLFALKRLVPAEQGLEQFSHWDNREFEKMLRVTSLIGFFVSGLSNSNQGILWITDEDPIVANDKYLTETRWMGRVVMEWFEGANRRNFDITTTAHDEGSMIYRDLVAVPDLIAGALSEMLSKMYLSDLMPNNERKVTPFPNTVGDKSLRIIKWFSDYSHPLKRLLCVIPPRSAPWSISVINFKTIE